MREGLIDGLDESLGLPRSGGGTLADPLSDGQAAAHRVPGGVEWRARQESAGESGADEDRADQRQQPYVGQRQQP
ncbi:hypothetical protein [Streptomyces phaeoluteigriseus]|uniref:hypothetical protein n=1 Tax=Streptomyces phaeoluteigriseus TaxID=114686 RepID=UPI0036779F3B